MIRRFKMTALRDSWSPTWSLGFDGAVHHLKRLGDRVISVSDVGAGSLLTVHRPPPSSTITESGQWHSNVLKAQPTK